jgi:alpha-tubulin suppressor-like RCC1 family protein
MDLENVEGVLYWGHNKKVGPSPVPHLKKFDIITISSGSNHFVFASSDGIYGFG